ncbi:MAG: TrkA family potassium uptake protein [Planctomycetes bacterium]|nr:TrkA family potassium uptake protein [Planctomycetota bacterium]
MTAKRKQVCVIGLGQFGAELAKRLAKYCEVLAIDSTVERVDLIANHVHSARCLDVRDFDSLRTLISEEFDEVILSIGDNIEASILGTLFIARLGVKTIRVKAKNDDHAEILTAIGATHIIYPEKETAIRIAAQIYSPGLREMLPLSEDFQVREIETPKSFVGRALSEIRLRNEYEAFALAIKCGATNKLTFMPPASYVLTEKDVMILIGKEENLMKLQELSAT